MSRARNHGPLASGGRGRRVRGDGLVARARRQNPPAPIPVLGFGSRVSGSTRNSKLETPNCRQVATCIGCGCTDNRACIDQMFGTPCSWLKVAYKLGIGVCSRCEHKLEEFELELRRLRPLSPSAAYTPSNLEKICGGRETEE